MAPRNASRASSGPSRTSTSTPPCSRSAAVNSAGVGGTRGSPRSRPRAPRAQPSCSTSARCSATTARDLLDLRARDLAALEALADARERAPLDHLAEVAIHDVGDQHARRVGPDVDAGAEHSARAMLPSWPGDRDRGGRPDQGLRRARGGAGHRFRGPPRRGVRPARPQRGGQDDDRRDPRGLPQPQRRSRVRARLRPGQPRPRPAGADGDRAAELGHLPVPDGARVGRALGGLLPAPARRRGGHLDRRPRAERRAARQQALGRPAAPARPRARAGRGSRAGLPRRADHRLRPRRAPRRVGDGALAQGARQDRAADHALPRRGAGARRPRGDHQGRPDPRRGAAVLAGRGLGALARVLARARTGSTRARPRTRRRCCTS